MEASWLEIDLQALAGNVAAFRGWLAGARLCAVVKADAYGVGADRLVRTLLQAGVDQLAVYSPRQALQVLALQPRCPVLVFMPAWDLATDADLRQAASTGRLHFTVHDRDGLGRLAELARAAAVALPVHVYVDTGMSRAGVSERELPRIVAEVAQSPSLRLAGLYTHFASADTDPGSLADQHQRFLAAVRALTLGPGVMLHAANTYAALRSRTYHHDMVRVGLGLHGYGGEVVAADAAPEHAGPRLRPVLRWGSRLAHVATYPAGATVGYNETHRLTRDSRLALIPAGYADGYPLSLSGKGVVTLCDDLGRAVAAAPVLGRVNMDQIVVDITDVPDAHVGQRVDLISADPTAPSALPKLAALAGSHCYEMLCRLSSRLPRRYVE